MSVCLPPAGSTAWSAAAVTAVAEMQQLLASAEPAPLEESPATSDWAPAAPAPASAWASTPAQTPESAPAPAQAQAQESASASASASASTPAPTTTPSPGAAPAPTSNAPSAADAQAAGGGGNSDAAPGTGTGAGAGAGDRAQAPAPQAARGSAQPVAGWNPAELTHTPAVLAGLAAVLAHVPQGAHAALRGPAVPGRPGGSRAPDAAPARPSTTPPVSTPVPGLNLPPAALAGRRQPPNAAIAASTAQRPNDAATGRGTAPEGSAPPAPVPPGRSRLPGARPSAEAVPLPTPFTSQLSGLLPEAAAARAAGKRPGAGETAATPAAPLNNPAESQAPAGRSAGTVPAGAPQRADVGSEPDDRAAATAPLPVQALVPAQPAHVFRTADPQPEPDEAERDDQQERRGQGEDADADADHDEAPAPATPADAEPAAALEPAQAHQPIDSSLVEASQLRAWLREAGQSAALADWQAGRPVLLVLPSHTDGDLQHAMAWLLDDTKRGLHAARFAARWRAQAAPAAGRPHGWCSWQVRECGHPTAFAGTPQRAATPGGAVAVVRTEPTLVVQLGPAVDRRRAPPAALLDIPQGQRLRRLLAGSRGFTVVTGPAGLIARKEIISG